MVDILPTFEQPPSGPSVTYNFDDIQEGTSVKEFYPLTAATATSTYEKRMTSSTGVWSENLGVTEGLNTIDMDFDLTFNLSQEIKGVMYVQCPISISATSGTVTGSITVTIIHYDGSTETTIGTAITSPVLSTTSTSFVNTMTTIKFLIARTHFEAGETLRINVTGAETGNIATSYLGHSPVGSQSTASGSVFEGLGTSRMTVFVPFVLDVGS